MLLARSLAAGSVVEFAVVEARLVVVPYADHDRALEQLMQSAALGQRVAVDQPVVVGVQRQPGEARIARGIAGVADRRQVHVRSPAGLAIRRDMGCSIAAPGSAA